MKIILIFGLLMRLFSYESQTVSRPAIISKVIDKIFAEGHWTSWSPQICDAVCGDGRTFRKRLCVPSEEFFGIPTCHGLSIERLSESCKASCPAVNQLRSWYFGPTLPQSLEKSLKEHLASGNYAFNRKVGGSTQFDCYNSLTVEFLVNYTRSVIYWEFNGNKLQYDFRRMMLHDYSILGLNDLRTSDSGVYTCNAGIGKKLKRTIMVFTLIVIGQPYQMEISSGSDVEVACHGEFMAKLFPALQATWILNSSIHVIKKYSLDVSEKVNGPDIIRAKQNYTGMWACVIADSIYNRTWVTNAFYVKVNPNWFLETLNSLMPTSTVGIILVAVFLMTLLSMFCAIIYFCYRYCIKRKRRKTFNSADEDEKLL